MVKPICDSDPSKGTHSVEVGSVLPPISRIFESKTALVCSFLFTKVLVKKVQEPSSSFSHLSSRQLTTIVPTVSSVKEDFVSKVSSRQVSNSGDQISGALAPPTIKRVSG